MENEAEEVIIIVGRLEHSHYTNGRECECAICHKAGWLSDSSIDAVHEAELNGQPVKLICMICFIPYHKSQNGAEEIKIMPFTEGQKDELTSFFKT